MRSRGLVVAIAVVLAVLAAVGVIVYTSSVREKAVDENTTPVLASTQDIQANTPLDPLIAQGVFQTIQVPNDGVVPDAVTDVSQLQGQTATAPDLPERADPARPHLLRAQNILGIDPGNVGLGLEVEGQAAVNGTVQQGDNISIYATFSRGTLVTKQSLKFFLTPAQLQKAVQQALGGTPVSGASQNVFQMQTDFTVALVPSVEGPVGAEPARRHDQRSRRPAVRPRTCLNMTPEDAQELVFATGHSTLYVGLLPPENDGGYPQPGTIGVPFGKVIGVQYDGSQRRRRRDAAVVPPTDRSSARARGGRGGLGAVRHGRRGAVDQRVRAGRRPRAVARGQGARRTRPGRVRRADLAGYGDRARPRPHVERAAAGGDARGHPRRRRHDAGDRRAPRGGRARRPVGGEPPLGERRHAGRTAAGSVAGTSSRCSRPRAGRARRS